MIWETRGAWLILPSYFLLVVVKPEVGPADVGNNKQYNPKPNGRASQSKPKPKKQKRNQRPWYNNKKKIRWKDQLSTPSFPDHLLQAAEVPNDVAKEMRAIFDRAQIHGIDQIDGTVYYDTNCGEDDANNDDDSTFHNTAQVESELYDTNHDDVQLKNDGETINNDFNKPVDFSFLDVLLLFDSLPLSASSSSTVRFDSAAPFT